MTCLCVTKRKKENFQLKLWTILLSTSAIKKYLLKSINLSLLYTRSPLLYHQSHHHRSSPPSFFPLILKFIHHQHFTFILVLLLPPPAAFLSTISKNYLNEHCHEATSSSSINLIKQKKETDICISYSFTLLIWIYWNLLKVYRDLPL